jgi:hypothetical protein
MGAINPPLGGVTSLISGTPHIPQNTIPHYSLSSKSRDQSHNQLHPMPHQSLGMGTWLGLPQPHAIWRMWVATMNNNKNMNAIAKHHNKKFILLLG